MSFIILDDMLLKRSTLLVEFSRREVHREDVGVKGVELKDREPRNSEWVSFYSDASVEKVGYSPHQRNEWQVRPRKHRSDRGRWSRRRGRDLGCRIGGRI